MENIYDVAIVAFELIETKIVMSMYENRKVIHYNRCTQFYYKIVFEKNGVKRRARKGELNVRKIKKVKSGD